VTNEELSSESRLRPAAPSAPRSRVGQHLTSNGKHPRTSFGRDRGCLHSPTTSAVQAPQYPLQGDAVFTLAVLTTVQNHAPPAPWQSIPLPLLLIMVVVLIIIGKVLTSHIGTLAAVTAAIVANMFANLRTLIVVLLGVLAIALGYVGMDNGGTGAPLGPSSTQSSTPNVAC